MFILLLRQTLKFLRVFQLLTPGSYQIWLTSLHRSFTRASLAFLDFIIANSGITSVGYCNFILLSLDSFQLTYQLRNFLCIRVALL